MKVVWKFPVGDWVAFKHPTKIVKAGEQGLVPFVWGEVELGVELETKRRFQVFGTHAAIPDSANYVGSFTKLNNKGVYLEFHTYEVFE